MEIELTNLPGILFNIIESMRLQQATLLPIRTSLITAGCVMTEQRQRLKTAGCVMTEQRQRLNTAGCVMTEQRQHVNTAGCVMAECRFLNNAQCLHHSRTKPTSD